jgi:hypothetical protein
LNGIENEHATSFPTRCDRSSVRNQLSIVDGC